MENLYNVRKYTKKDMDYLSDDYENFSDDSQSEICEFYTGNRSGNNGGKPLSEEEVIKRNSTLNSIIDYLDEPKVLSEDSSYMHGIEDVNGSNSLKINNNLENFKSKKKEIKKNQRTKSLVAMLRQNFELDSDQKLSSVEIKELKEEKGDDIFKEIEKTRNLNFTKKDSNGNEEVKKNSLTQEELERKDNIFGNSEKDVEEEEEEIKSQGYGISQSHKRRKCPSRVRLSHDQMVDMQERALKVFEKCRLEISRMIAETHIKQNTIIKQEDSVRMLTEKNNTYSTCSITDGNALVQNNNSEKRIENITLNGKYDKNLALKLPIAEKEESAVIEKWVHGGYKQTGMPSTPEARSRNREIMDTARNKDYNKDLTTINILLPKQIDRDNIAIKIIFSSKLNNANKQHYLANSNNPDVSVAIQGNFPIN